MIRIAKKSARGFTLIELMIVVAIVGILAVLAVFGVRKYLTSAKSAEATNTMGELQRLSIAAYERESAPAELVIGASSAGASHSLCTTAAVVPLALTAVANKKYTASTTAGNDYDTGSSTAGWKCLKFTMNSPQAYQYGYYAGVTTNTLTTSGITSFPTLTAGWTVEAQSDFDGDNTPGQWATGGSISNGTAVPLTEIANANTDE